jgi:mycothiol synthase
MEIALDPLPLVGELGEGYYLQPWDQSQIELHAEVKYESFRFEIDANVFPCLGDRDGCQRLMREIANKQGFTPEATWLAYYQATSVAEPEYCGTIQGILDPNGLGSIQNLGVTPTHRGRKLGVALMYQALSGFRSVGMRRAYLEVTARNVDAIRLYQRLGFQKVRTVYKASELEYSR